MATTNARSLINLTETGARKVSRRDFLSIVKSYLETVQQLLENIEFSYSGFSKWISQLFDILVGQQLLSAAVNDLERGNGDGGRIF